MCDSSLNPSLLVARCRTVRVSAGGEPDRLLRESLSPIIITDHAFDPALYNLNVALPTTLPGVIILRKILDRLVDLAPGTAGIPKANVDLRQLVSSPQTVWMIAQTTLCIEHKVLRLM